MKKANIKFNGGNPAFLCINCSRIVKTASDGFTQEENDFCKGTIEYLPAHYCDKCTSLKNEIDKRYGNFELSHDKNQLIVDNILEFITKHHLVQDFYNR